MTPDPLNKLRDSIHVILVRPQKGVNVGAALRAVANMDVRGAFSIVGTPEIIDDECLRTAKHARDAIDRIVFCRTLGEALGERNGLVLGATARVDSVTRPHAMAVREAMAAAVKKKLHGEIEKICLVFGPEGDGLSNEEIKACDWVVTIPTTAQYSVLNLAQAVLVFVYEANMAILELSRVDHIDATGPKRAFIKKFIDMAEKAGFVFDGDSQKMKPRLEAILNTLRVDERDASTLHGLVDQLSRSLERGKPDLKGRFKGFAGQDEQ